MKLLFINRLNSFPMDNCKYLFLESLNRGYDSVYFLNDYFYKAVISTNKSLPFFPLSKIESFLKENKCELCIIDNWLSRDIFERLPKNLPILQLWHGIPIKDISLVHPSFRIPRLTKFFLFPSEKTKPLFKDVFLYERAVYAGYPRNLAMFKSNNDFLLGCDEEALDFIFTFREEGRKLILFAPTFRRDGATISISRTQMFSEGFLLRLDKMAEKFGASFVVKLHPLVSAWENLINEFLRTLKVKNIFIYPAHADIYPLLKYFDLLVSDYSSILWDWVLLKKPFLIYFPDYELVKHELLSYTLIDSLYRIPDKILTNESELLLSLKKFLKEKLKFNNACLSSLGRICFKNQENCIEDIFKEVCF